MEGKGTQNTFLYSVKPSIFKGLQRRATVYYPIWWGGLPKVIYTFLESYALDGKIIVPFCTSGSSGIDKSIQEINTLVPNADVQDGRRFSGRESDADISE